MSDAYIKHMEFTQQEEQEFDEWCEEEDMESEVQYCGEFCNNFVMKLEETINEKGFDWVDNERNLLYMILDNKEELQGYPDPDKCWLMFKDTDMNDDAKKIFFNHESWIRRITQWSYCDEDLDIIEDEEIMEIVAEYYNIPSSPEVLE